MNVGGKSSKNRFCVKNRRKFYQIRGICQKIDFLMVKKMLSIRLFQILKAGTSSSHTGHECEPELNFELEKLEKKTERNTFI